MLELTNRDTKDNSIDCLLNLLDSRDFYRSITIAISVRKFYQDKSINSKRVYYESDNVLNVIEDNIVVTIINKQEFVDLISKNDDIFVN